MAGGVASGSFAAWLVKEVRPLLESREEPTFLSLSRGPSEGQVRWESGDSIYLSSSSFSEPAGPR